MTDDRDPYRFDRPIKTIAIIGAGSSGTVLAKAALSEGFTSIRIFEQRSDIGGAWLYTTETSEPPCVPSVDAFTIDPPLKGIPPRFISPMYTNLWANTPRDAMTFADKEFPEGTPYFPFRKQILQYLKDYGNDIRHLVEFNKEVARVEKNGKWCLTIRDLLTSSKKETVEEFDAVAVATGHYDIPNIPSISGIETFPAKKITHAKYFRHASAYESKNVLLIGNGPSGADLANQLLYHAHSVVRSVRSEPNPLAVANPKIKDLAPIKRFTKDTIELVDGTTLKELDMVIFCTSYLYTLPMFPKEAGFITPDGAYVHQLYRQTFYAEDPTLAIMGLPKQVIPFPTFQNQAIIVAKVWAGRLPLPSREVMKKDEFARLEKKGFEAPKYHSFKYPEDVELAEGWRLWAEEDKSEGWEKRMKPWRWTEEKVKIRNGAPEMKGKFLKEIEEGKWDDFQFQEP